MPRAGLTLVHAAVYQRRSARRVPRNAAAAEAAGREL